MSPSAAGTAGPLTVYQRMQEALVGDGATLLPAELLAEDVVVETPFSPPGMRRHEGREAWLAFYRARSAVLPVRFEQFRELATHQTHDPEVIVVEYELAGTVTTTGLRASATLIGVLRVRDGLIQHWREYQDILAISEALKLTPQDLGGAGTPAP
ncbi:nuclear transport factor 2 family protein [Myxococcus sp. CA051A]|uniref:nuclear transport factor 2 family protein n=1 Tax=unclassified Myxococcus TaxID=2648731 RepID=UPI00157BA95F|nr:MULTISPECIES: nuclear transport factor 2 family protein [unclassified Myxococcus]NTX07512.1 nuclear transport factor 2 family protein [Myxococcus sp. CA040A]NTX10813.1 nuclear transport factor 2 family protein [Myxococcus sp. CA056]NTX37299.1 nuclear transport factor 2 family protein [Myxococcus sp. CA033]NTX56260.1 nuclear transport factor 2 family protein [Myxococcus sp. CA039A]NTX66153.1 nuclear transport factor 2 family protein [Myxococcus sp. CA051A]